MISRRDLLLSGVAASAALPFGSTDIFAQADYPTRDIHSICGFPPGTGADVFVRFYGRLLQDRVKRTVVTENRAGAFGNIATEYVSKAKPDGYTIFIAPGSSFLAAAANLFKKLPFDPVNDFEHITTLSKLPFVLYVSGDTPHMNVADLVKSLKEKGDKASYASVANTGLVSSELFKANFGLPTVEVKYKEASQALTDLWGGQVAFMHLDPITASAHVKSGKLRPLATSSADRFKALPDVPSAREQGINNSNVIAWWSVHVPKGTPKPIIDRLEKEFNDIAQSEEHIKFLAPLGSDPFPGNQASVKKILVDDIKAWGDYVKLAKIELLG